MRRRERNLRTWVFSTALTVVLTACSAPEPLALDQYVASMQDVENTFAGQIIDPRSPGVRDGYPMGGTVVVATAMAIAYETRVEGWSALSAPDEVAVAHERLVTSVERLRSAVAVHVETAAATGAVDLVLMAQTIEPLAAEANAACTALAAALLLNGRRIGFADACQF